MTHSAPNWETGSRRQQTRTMLSAKDELQLILAWQQHGDKSARDQLIAAFAPLAAATARRFASGSGVSDPDLVQQANIGLVKAADRFDPERGFRFSTYAVWWVRAEIRDFRLANMSVVRRPNSADFRKAVFNLARVESDVSAGQNITKAEVDTRVAHALSVTVPRLNELRMQMPGTDASLNVPTFGDDGEERVSLLTDPASLDAETGLSAMDTDKLRNVLLTVMRDLPDRERAIIVATQIADPPSTLDVLGARFGISRERVRQLRERGFERRAMHCSSRI